jgi:Holliday junction resolvase
MRNRFVKRDSFHAEAVRFLEAVGFSVYDAAHAGHSLPDLVVGAAGVTDLVELKTGNAPLTDGQAVFLERWRGRPVVVLRSMAAVKEWALRQLHERRRSITPAVVHVGAAQAEMVDGRYTGRTPKE